MAAHSPSASVKTPVLNSKAAVGFAVQRSRLVPPRDARALGEALTALLKDNDLRQAMGKRCRQRAIEQYDERLFSERHLDLYNELGGRGEP